MMLTIREPFVSSWDACSETERGRTGVTVTFTGPSGTGGPGTNAVWAVLDLKSSAAGVIDLFVGICRTFDSSGMGCSITSPSGYNAMTLEQTEPTSAVDDYLYYWDGAHTYALPV